MYLSSFSVLSFHQEKNFLEEKTMNLSQRLYEITCNKDETKVKAFEKDIENHPEHKLLAACLERAKKGSSSISFGRNICPPEILNREGFHLEVDGCCFKYCWD